MIDEQLVVSFCLCCPLSCAGNTGLRAIPFYEVDLYNEEDAAASCRVLLDDVYMLM